MTAPELVLVDLDNTLLIGDSDYEWGQFLIDRGIVERVSYEARTREFYEHYKAGTLDIYEFLSFSLAPLAAHPRPQLDQWHRDFMLDRIEPMIGHAALDLVATHRARGALMAIVTATNAFVTAPIARRFGIDHLIAVDLEEHNGRFTGRPIGTPSFRAGKVIRVHEWLATLGPSLDQFPVSRFYSDSVNDLPLLEQVTHPIAVDPDDRLAAVAQDRSWEIISLRPPNNA